MKVWFVSSWHPWPADNGARRRVLQLVEALARTHDVSLCVLDDREVAVQLGPLREMCARVDHLRRPRYRPRSVAGRAGLLSVRPRSLASTYDRALEARLGATAEELDPELVIASELPAGAYRRAFGARPTLLEDLEPGQYRGPDDAGPLGRLRHGLMRAKLAAYLRRLLPRYTACTVVSDEERRLLESLVPAYDRVHVVPNAVRVSAPVAEPRQGDGLVFTGSMTFRPNRQGLEWFVREVLPEVRARRPDAVLRVTGDPGPVDFSQAAGVEMLGYVDDLSRPMGDAAVAIVPIWSGGGTRIKLLEALAARKAVVSTTLGAEGLRVEHGRHLLIADDREAWVEAIVELLEHGERRAELAAAGRALVEERYDSRRVGDRFVQLAEQIASRSPAAEVRP